jgi:hypothetical protein
MAAFERRISPQRNSDELMQIKSAYDRVAPIANVGVVNYSASAFSLGYTRAAAQD